MHLQNSIKLRNYFTNLKQLRVYDTDQFYDNNINLIFLMSFHMFY